MPTLNLKIAPLQNPERYTALAKAMTDITHEVLGKRRDVTANDWAYCGRTQLDRLRERAAEVA